MQLAHDPLSALLTFLSEACGVSRSRGQATGFSPPLKGNSKAHQETVFCNRKGEKRFFNALCPDEWRCLHSQWGGGGYGCDILKCCPSSSYHQRYKVQPLCQRECYYQLWVARNVTVLFMWVFRKGEWTWHNVFAGTLRAISKDVLILHKIMLKYM